MPECADRRLHLFNRHNGRHWWRRISDRRLTGRGRRGPDGAGRHHPGSHRRARQPTVQPLPRDRDQDRVGRPRRLRPGRERDTSRHERGRPTAHRHGSGSPDHVRRRGRDEDRSRLSWSSSGSARPHPKNCAAGTACDCNFQIRNTGSSSKRFPRQSRAMPETVAAPFTPAADHHRLDQCVAHTEGVMTRFRRPCGCTGHFPPEVAAVNCAASVNSAWTTAMLLR